MGFISRQIEDRYRKVLFSRHDPDDRIFYFSHRDFWGLLRREYSFESSKGYMIRGQFYFYANPRTDRIIVFDHGLAPWHRSYMREIEMLCRQGYAVYAYDHTGCGDSEGEHVMGLCGSLCDLDDCLYVFRGLEELADKEIYVVGHSWGGFSTLNILAFHPEVKKIVAMSGFISLEVMQKQVAPFILAPFRKQIFELERRYNPEYVYCSAIDALSKCDTPAFIIHSADDMTVSVKANFMRLQRELAGRPNTEFLLLTDRNHNPTFTKEAVEYKKEFFKALAKHKKQGTLTTDEEKAKFIASYDWNKMTEQDIEVWDRIYSFLDR